jgi:hypothetical protein
MSNTNIPAWAGKRACDLANKHMKGKERYDWREDCNIPSIIAFAAYIAKTEGGSKSGLPDPSEDSDIPWIEAFADRIAEHEGVTKLVTLHNLHTGMAYTVRQSSIPCAADPDECEDCDGYGRIWSNADPSSGRWVPCDCGAA